MKNARDEEVASQNHRNNLKKVTKTPSLSWSVMEGLVTGVAALSIIQ